MDRSNSLSRAPMMPVALLLLTLAGCETVQSFYRHDDVSAQLSDRMGSQLRPVDISGDTAIPPTVDPTDGLTEEEAVATALWNNSAYRELLTQLGISNARLYDAGLLTDPQMTMFLPLGPKQFEFTIFFIVDAVWLRPIRQRAAGLDLSNVAEGMVQNGLNVIRDARLAHADLLIAQKRAKLANEAAKIQAEIAELAQKRFKAGDIAKLEVNTAEVESLQAQADAARIAQDVVLARNRLRTIMGLTLQEVTLKATDGQPADLTGRNSSDLVNEALAFRPDLRAAELNVQAACERAALARRQFFNFDAVYDANSRGTRGFESGPGLRMTLPIFNRNRGNIAIASEQVRQANRQILTVRDQITLDVRTAYVQMVQARENLQATRTKILPKLKTAVELARKNYRAGGATYFLVLQTTRQYVDARVRELEMELALRRAIAELERSVGHRLNGGVDASTQRDNSESVAVVRLGALRNTNDVKKVFPAPVRRASSTEKPSIRQNQHALFTFDVRLDPAVLPGWLRKTVVKEREEDGAGQGRPASVRREHLAPHADAQSR